MRRKKKEKGPKKLFFDTFRVPPFFLITSCYSLFFNIFHPRDCFFFSLARRSAVSLMWIWKLNFRLRSGDNLIEILVAVRLRANGFSFTLPSELLLDSSCWPFDCKPMFVWSDSFVVLQWTSAGVLSDTMCWYLGWVSSKRPSFLRLCLSNR